MYIPDNYDAFRENEARADRAYQDWAESLPICFECEKPIKGDILYAIGGELFCEHCIEEAKTNAGKYRRNI